MAYFPFEKQWYVQFLRGDSAKLYVLYTILNIANYGQLLQ